MMSMNEIKSEVIYNLVLALSSYTEIKRKILLCLAHIYPRAVSGTQLSMMIGYSGKARTLYRGVLDHLEDDNAILLDKLTPKLYSIRINHNHPLMKVLIDLCQTYGKSLKEKYGLIAEKGENLE